MSDHKWITKNEEEIVDTPIMKLVRRNCYASFDPKRLHPFYVLKSRDWCNIIPITEDQKIIMIRQFRNGVDHSILEIPGGVVEESEKDLEKTALRELKEETGYEPISGAQCDYLGWGYPNPAILDNKVHSFVVGPVKKVSEQALDPGEFISIEEIEIEKIPELILNREINHSLIVNAFFHLSLKNKDASKLLIEEMRRRETL